MGGPRAKARRRKPTTQTDVSGVRHRLLNAAAVQSSPFRPAFSLRMRNARSIEEVGE